MIRHLALATLLIAAAGIASASLAVETGGADPWAPIDALMRERFAHSGLDSLKGMGLAVYDAGDHALFTRMYGDFALDRQIAIASSSKLVAGVVIFDVIATSHGALTLDSTTGAILGWTGPKADITLRHLLSFTSGLPPDAPGTANPKLSLAECVEGIAALTPTAKPGERFDYGSTHLQVAARMAEVVTGKSWNALLRERVATPLGLPADVACYTWPKLSLGTTNPLIAGGMRASMASYAPILAIVFHRGAGKGFTIGSEELFTAQTKEPFAAAIGHSPAQLLGIPSHYGLTAWLEGATPREGSDIISSAGAFGFVPWLDRRAGYYAILGMELPMGTRFSVPLEQELEPLIRAALAAKAPPRQ